MKSKWGGLFYEPENVTDWLKLIYGRLGWVMFWLIIGIIGIINALPD